MNFMTLTTLIGLSPQARKIYDHMQKAGSISAREAMADYGITSATLARRICDLEGAGFKITRETREHPIHQRKYTRYSLASAGLPPMQEQAQSAVAAPEEPEGELKVGDRVQHVKTNSAVSGLIGVVKAPASRGGWVFCAWEGFTRGRTDERLGIPEGSGWEVQQHNLRKVA